MTTRVTIANRAGTPTRLTMTKGVDMGLGCPPDCPACEEDRKRARGPTMGVLDDVVPAGAADWRKYNFPVTTFKLDPIALDKIAFTTRLQYYPFLKETSPMSTKTRCSDCPEPEPDKSNAVKPGYRVGYIGRDDEGDNFNLDFVRDTFDTPEAAAAAGRDKLEALKASGIYRNSAAYVFQVVQRVTLEPTPYVVETTWGEPEPTEDVTAAGPTSPTKASKAA